MGTIVVSQVATSSGPQHAGGLPLVGCVLTNSDDTFGTHVLGAVLDASNGVANVVVKRTLGDILDRAFDGVPVSTVCSDNVDAAKRATEHLFALGHDRVGLVTSSSAVSTIEDRHEGFVHAHAEFHVPHDPANDFRSVRSTIPGSAAKSADDVEQLVAYLTTHSRLTGLVATEYSIAVLLREACERLGRDVPRDLSIICFDHPDPFPSFMFRFAHMRQDQQGMGAAALDQALTQVADSHLVKKVSLETELVAGGSTASP